nr:hypothetical protein [Nostoc sp. CmiVER01]MDZ8124542.1 hypothetical protein [Nostoc sp. CmiVER01]
MASDSNSVFGNTINSGNSDGQASKPSDPFASGGAFGIPTADSFDFDKYGIPKEGSFSLGSSGIPTADSFDPSKYGIPTADSFNPSQYGIPTGGNIPNIGGSPTA